MKYFFVFVHCGVINFQFIPESPQKGIIDQRLRGHVGGENYELVKGDLEFYSGMKSQIIHPVIERHNPSIQKGFRIHLLPSEIIQDKHPVVGFHVQGAS
jgi:hypothetical protein